MAMAKPKQRVARKLAAILAADVAGYARLMGLDEVGSLRLLTERRQIMDSIIAEHGGHIVNTAGDGVLAEFPSAVDAVQCAVETQERLAQASASDPADRRLEFRIGVHAGDVMVRNGDLFGDGVNIAARLQALAQPGGVCVSGAVHEHVRKVLPLRFLDLGPQVVKHNDEPVRVYSLSSGDAPEPASGAQPDRPRPLPLPDRPSIAVLPFTNLSGDPEQEYFADGLVEDIITALSRVRSFFVIARNSSFTYKGRAVDVRRVCRASSAFATCSKASGKPARGCASSGSWSTAPPGITSGPTASRAMSATSSSCRTKSPKASWAPWSRASASRRSGRRAPNPPAPLRLMTSICAPCRDSTA
jgi:adenylate cyclase